MSGFTAVRMRDPGVDRHGDPLEGVPTEETFENCPLWPRSVVGGALSSENNDAANSVSQGINIVVPYDADVRPSDTFRIVAPEYADVVFEVIGEVARWSSPLTGSRPGAVVSLQRYSG